MPLLDHLIELRKRLIYSVLGFLIVAFVGCYFVSEHILDFLVAAAGRRLDSASTARRCRRSSIPA